MNLTIGQLRVDAFVSGVNFLRYRRRLASLSKATARSHCVEAKQDLDNCLNAAETYQVALSDLWKALLKTSPAPGSYAEIKAIMMFNEFVIVELDRILKSERFSTERGAVISAKAR